MRDVDDGEFFTLRRFTSEQDVAAHYDFDFRFDITMAFRLPLYLASRFTIR